MSSSTYIVTALKSADAYLYRFGGPILMLAGTVGCLLNIIVFIQKNLRKNPCSIYFIAFNMANFLYIWSSLLPLTLRLGYNVDASIYYLILCRLRFYITALSNCLSAFYLILASIDRILITSSNARTRQRSTLHFAYMCIGIGTSFWTLFHIHALISTNIIQIGPRTVICYFQPGVYLAFVSYYALIKELSGLVFLMICGLWSTKNIRTSARRIVPVTIASVSRIPAASHLRSTSAKDRQFMLMLLMEIIIYLSFSLMFVLFLIYQQITQNGIKNSDQTQIENCVRDFCLFGVSISFGSSCYANLLASKTFRSEVKKIFVTARNLLH